MVRFHAAKLIRPNLKIFLNRGAKERARRGTVNVPRTSERLSNKDLGKYRDLAESEGFEPSRPAKVCRFSRPVLSTAQPTLRRPIY